MTYRARSLSYGVASLLIVCVAICALSLPRSDISPFYSVALSPNGERAITVTRDGQFALWSVGTGEFQRILKSPSSAPTLLKSGPKGHYLAAAFEAGDSSKRHIEIWRVDDGVCVEQISGHINRITDLAFSPDGRLVVSSSDDRTVRVWNIDTGQSIGVFQHKAAVNAVAVSPDCRCVLSAAGDYIQGNPIDTTLRLWLMVDGSLQRVLTGHTQPVRDVEFFPDGMHAVSVGRDETIRVWDMETGREIRQFACESCKFITVVNQGNWLLTCSDDGTLSLLDAISGEVLSKAVTKVPILSFAVSESRNIAATTHGLLTRRRATTIKGWESVWKDSAIVIWNTQSLEEVRRFSE